MFAYCNNDPENCSDSKGNVPSCTFDLKDEGGVREPVYHVVYYDVPLYKQGSTKLCWACCELMMISYYNETRLSKKEVRTERRNRAIARLEEGETTWNIGRSITQVDFKESASDIFELYKLLKDRGPVYACYTRGVNKGHTVVVIGVDVEMDIVYTLNPWGVRGEQSFSDFQKGPAKRFIDPPYDYELEGLYPPKF